jgi:hypothetical protein
MGLVTVSQREDHPRRLPVSLTLGGGGLWSPFFELAPPQRRESIKKDYGSQMERDRGWTRFRRELRNPTWGDENQNGMPSTTSTEDNNKVQTMGGKRNVGGEKRSGRVLSR